MIKDAASVGGRPDALGQMPLELTRKVVLVPPLRQIRSKITDRLEIQDSSDLQGRQSSSYLFGPLFWASFPS